MHQCYICYYYIFIDKTLDLGALLLYQDCYREKKNKYNLTLVFPSFLPIKTFFFLQIFLTVVTNRTQEHLTKKGVLVCI